MAEGVAVETVSTPVNLGDNANIAIKTNVGSTCVISVTYNGIANKDSGLSSKVTDELGDVSWSWTIEKSVPVGSWPIKVTCTHNGKSAVVISNIQIVKT